MPSVILYGTLGCHLCEEAEAIVAPLIAAARAEWRKIDIADDEALMERYGIRIPVLQRCADNAELGWPFSAEDVLEFISA